MPIRYSLDFCLAFKVCPSSLTALMLYVPFPCAAPRVLGPLFLCLCCAEDCFQRCLPCLGSDGGLAHLGITVWHLRTPLSPLIGPTTTLAGMQNITLASQEHRAGRQQRKEVRSWHSDSFLHSLEGSSSVPVQWLWGGGDTVHLPSPHGLRGTPALDQPKPLLSPLPVAPRRDSVSGLEVTISRFPLRISGLVANQSRDQPQSISERPGLKAPVEPPGTGAGSCLRNPKTPFIIVLVFVIGPTGDHSGDLPGCRRNSPARAAAHTVGEAT